MTASRMGRPRKKLKAAKALVTRRVRHLIDLAHDGNVLEASKVSGVPAATLRALYTGRISNPQMATLERLGNAYGIFPAWFMDPKEPDRVPLGGIFLSRLVYGSDGWWGQEQAKDILIPWASWPLPDVYKRLYDYLASLPPEKERPILGDGIVKAQEGMHRSVEPGELAARVALFLLGPLEQAMEVMGREPLTLDEDYMDEDIIRHLRKLGLFWQDALADILGR